MSLARHKLYAEVKRAYMAGESSLRTLSQRYGVSLNTLEKRSSREKWQQEITALYGIVTAAAAKAAEEGGREMGQSAAAFEQRSINETWAWLDEIEALRLAGIKDADTALKLVHAWSSTISVGREAYRLDEPQAAPPAISFSRIEMHLHQAGDGAIDCPTARLPESCAAREMVTRPSDRKANEMTARKQVKVERPEQAQARPNASSTAV